MKYFPKISGERVYLSPISLEDAELYTEWLNDLETTRFLTVASLQVTLHGEKEVLGGLSKGHVYAVIEKASGALIGNCGFVEIEQTSRAAEVGIFIGPEAKRGSGYGTEALGLLCDYGFNVLNLRSVMLRVYAYNERAIACYRKAGFKEIGLRRKAHFFGGEYHDILLMDLLPEEFGPSRVPPVGFTGGV
jgi:RimJ/RimL family protein N-acetyltransferase